MEEATEKFREDRPNFREDIKLFIGLPKQPLLELSPPVINTHVNLIFNDAFDRRLGVRLNFMASTTGKP